MGDFFVDYVFDRIHDHLWNQGKDEPAKSQIEAQEFECRRLESDRYTLDFFGKAHWLYQRKDDLDRCRALKEPRPVTQEERAGSDFFAKALEGLESLGRGIEDFFEGQLEYWSNPPDMAGEMLKLMLSLALIGGAGGAARGAAKAAGKAGQVTPKGAR